MNPDNQLSLITSILQSDPKIFRPFEMELVKDFNKNSDIVTDVCSLNFDQYTKRGLIIQTQKVKFIINFIILIFLFFKIL